MRKAFIIVLLLVLSLPFRAEVHREQFEYNWYAAKRSLDEERYARALVQFLFCDMVYPHDGMTKEYLGILFMSLHDTIRATHYFEQAYAIDPDVYWRRYANFLEQTGNLPKAMEIFEARLKKHPEDTDIRRELGFMLNGLMDIYFTKGEFDTALKTIDKYEKKYGQDYWTFYYRCLILHCQGKSKKAMELLESQLDTYDAFQTNRLWIDLLHTLPENTLRGRWNDLEKAYKTCYETMVEDDIYLDIDYAYDLAVIKHDLSAAEKFAATAIADNHCNTDDTRYCAKYFDTYGFILYLKGEKALANFYISKAYDIIQENNDHYDEETKNRIIKHYKMFNP